MLNKSESYLCRIILIKMILEIEKHDVMIRSANLKDESYKQKRVY